jgi:hypothetical protein
MDITPGYLSSIKRELAEADAEYAELGYPKGYRGLDYKYGEGTRYFEDVYASFSDGELLELIRERRERTGRPPLVNRRRDAMAAMPVEYNLDNAHTEFYIKLLKRVCRNRRLFGDAGPVYTKPIEQFKNISETLGRPRRGI